jgi:predicted nucleic acid-binding protein
MYLLDTNVVSELRRQRPHGAVVAWLRLLDQRDLFISAVTLGELQAGIEVTRERDATKATEIEAWVDRVQRPGTSCRWILRRFACGPGSCTGDPTI